MSVEQFLSVIRARWWVVLAALALVVGTTLGVSLVLPKKYTATATVVVDFKTPDLVTGALLPVLPGYLATQVDIIQSPRVALEVVRSLEMAKASGIRAQFEEATDGRGTIEDWLAARVLSGLDVEPSKESSVIAITYEANDPKFAAVLANAFARAYITTTLALKVEPARQTADWFDERLKQLRENLEKAQAKLSDYQQRSGIVASDERLDIESNRLAELSTQVVLLQSQAAESLNRLRQAEDFVRQQRPLDTLPEVLANPFVQGLRGDVLRAEAKLKELSERLGVNHPQYGQSRAELEVLRQRAAEEVRKVVTGLTNTHRVNEQKVADARAALAAQKAKVLSLKENRDELNVLLREVDTAQRAYDLAMQRFTQSDLESQATTTNVLLLTSASEPLTPSSPKIFLNVLVSLFLGAMVGVGAALLLELTDGRVRSVDDLAAALGVPVVGSLSRMQEEAPRRWWAVKRRHGHA